MSEKASPKRKRTTAVHTEGTSPQKKRPRKDTNVARIIEDPESQIAHLSDLQREAHLNRLALQDGLDKGKGTEDAYPRHVKNYVAFWNSDQERRHHENPDYKIVPAHPIFGEKVAIFLQHEITRSKRNRKGAEISGTSIGKESIKQTISALQRYMLSHQHEPEYYNCAETRVSLRNLDIVKVFETASCASEPKRIQNAHILKSKGTLNDTYTTTEIQRMSVWAMQTFGPSQNQIHIGIRDRAMLLLSTTLGFRGNSTRMVLLSDLFFRSLPMGNIGPGTLGIMADQSKTNVTGRVDEHGVFRHRIPELCGFGGIAFYLFSYFHIVGKAAPLFLPDFDDPAHSEFGRRDWYKKFLFPGKNKSDGIDGATEMTYDNHYERVSLMHKRNDVHVSAVTHAGRPFTAANARENGAAAIDTKVLGRWKSGDAYSEIYDRGLPRNAMLASANFEVQNPEAYVLPRGLLEPPPALCATIFPWVEGELAAYEARVSKYGPKAVDFSLKNFLLLLIELRGILLQDAAVLYQKYPDFNIWNYSPFTTPLFLKFSQMSTAIIERSEEDARHRLETLPTTVSRSMQGILQTIFIQQAQERSEISTQFKFIEGLMTSQSSARSSRYHSKDRSITPHPHATSPSLPAELNGLIPMSPLPLTRENSTCKPTHILDTNNAPSTEIPTSTNSPWPSDLLSFQYNFVLSVQDLKEQARQVSAIRHLITKYGAATVGSHQFEWMRYSSGPVSEEWLPIYMYKKALTVREVWEEWAEGVDGKLSVRQLCEGWEARWRRNNSALKTEASRRKHIIELVNELSSKPKWSVHLALRYLEDQYTIPGPEYLASATSFSKRLQNKVHGAVLRAEILRKGMDYCQ